MTFTKTKLPAAHLATAKTEPTSLDDLAVRTMAVNHARVKRTSVSVLALREHVRCGDSHRHKSQG